ncbi:metal ABC transporter permease [Fusobacterium sp. IOR10]|uniref:metal ABC transporter permease n=1 Tax=Fusobacterium sp. IOR10 TaxID=2665157 RepID=UPI0013D43385|nr:metal ABC transporter permease [Fusobacterium sp. IOR10]
METLIANNYILIIVIIGTTLIGCVSGILGTIITLRKEALVGNALAHASFPGVILSFMIMKNKNMELLLIGAGCFSAISLIIIKKIKKYSKIKYDSSLALILSGFFGLGQVLLSIVQNTGNPNQSGLENFIFGEVATILFSDIEIISIISIIVIFIIILLRKEIKLFIFDEEFFKSLGYSSKILDGLITILVIVVIMIGIRFIGVILMTSVLIAPSIAARQWSNSFYNNLILSGFFGGISGFLGTLVSLNNPDLSIGPIIVVISSLIAVTSIIFKKVK